VEQVGLSRRLGLSDAVFLGLGSMLGAGVFAAFAPAAAVAGSALLIGLAIAAVVAWCNASSSAQLAAVYPTSGGTYVYGREQLGPWWGFAAGWAFVIGKTASSAAMALTFAAYAVPAAWQRPVAAVAVAVLAGVNYAGISRTAQVTRVTVLLVLACLSVVVASGMSAGGGLPVVVSPVGGPEWYGVLQAAGLLFFAFAGYARVATMGEEVRDPRRTIGRAIIAALVVVLVLYAAVGVSLLLLVGDDALATATAPLTLLVGDHPAARAILAIGAVAAVGGSLLGLLSGIGRTWLAMSREGDLPRVFDHTHPRTLVPHRIELTLAVMLTVILLMADLRGAIGFSSFGVLLYYFVANVAAFTQGAAERRYAKAWQILGAALCLILVATLPWQSILGGMVVLAAGVLWRISSRALLR